MSEEKQQLFLEELTELSKKHGIILRGPHGYSAICTFTLDDIAYLGKYSWHESQQKYH